MADSLSRVDIDAAELARCLFDDSGDALLLFYPKNLRIVDANPLAQKLTKYTHQLMELTLFDLFDANDAELLQGFYHSCQVTALFHAREEYRLIRNIDESLEVNVTISRLHTKPNVLGVVSVRDISDRRILERRATQRAMELEAINAELNAFTQSVSHDLRAPLRAMAGFALALDEDYGDRLDDNGREFIRHISDSAARMDRLVNDLLEYCRLRRAPLSISRVELRSVIDEAMGLLSLDFAGSEVTVERNMPAVLGHRSTLLRVVTNLLSNGMKFVSKEVRPKVHVWAEPRHDRVRLWFEDNGIGIAPQHHDRIFGVFERLHGIESYPGTGIGLAIVARSSNRLGGQYGVESQLGRGSRFWVELPREANP